jgi:hypothetical protein
MQRQEENGGAEMIRARCWLGLRPGPSVLGSHVSPARYIQSCPPCPGRGSGAVLHRNSPPLSCCRHRQSSPNRQLHARTHAVLILCCLLLVLLWINGCVDQQQWISLLRSDLFHTMPRKGASGRAAFSNKVFAMT